MCSGAPLLGEQLAHITDMASTLTGWECMPCAVALGSSKQLYCHQQILHETDLFYHTIMQKTNFLYIVSHNITQALYCRG